jgi:hypothetical protein
VGCRVDEAEVGFDFGDAGGEALAVEVADEEFAEEGSGYDLGRAGVEASGEEFNGGTGLWGEAHILCGDFVLTSYFSIRFAYRWREHLGLGKVRSLPVGT